MRSWGMKYKSGSWKKLLIQWNEMFARVHMYEHYMNHIHDEVLKDVVYYCHDLCWILISMSEHFLKIPLYTHRTYIIHIYVNSLYIEWNHWNNFKWCSLCYRSYMHLVHFYIYIYVYRIYAYSPLFQYNQELLNK